VATALRGRVLGRDGPASRAPSPDRCAALRVHRWHGEADRRDRDAGRATFEGRAFTSTSPRFRVRRAPATGASKTSSLGGSTRRRRRRSAAPSTSRSGSAAKGEPAWDSPWGQGSSRLAHRVLGDVARPHGEGFDIHGGGADLISPHEKRARPGPGAGPPSRGTGFTTACMSAPRRWPSRSATQDAEGRVDAHGPQRDAAGGVRPATAAPVEMTVTASSTTPRSRRPDRRARPPGCESRESDRRGRATRRLPS